MDAQHSTVVASVRKAVGEVLSSLISKVESRDRARKMAFAYDARSPLDGTPRTSNTSTLEQPFISVDTPALKKIQFGKSSSSNFPKKNSAPIFKNLTTRTDGADVMESLFEQGYDSDGQPAPYLNVNAADLEELEETCDVPLGDEQTPNITNNSPAVVRAAGGGAFDDDAWGGLQGCHLGCKLYKT